MEMIAVIQEAGWTIHRRNKQSRKIYVYAAKRIDGKLKEVYIAPLHKIEKLTAESIKKKLEQEK